MRFKTVSNRKTVFRDSSPPINVTGRVKPSGAPMLSLDCNREVHEIVIGFFFFLLLLFFFFLKKISTLGVSGVPEQSNPTPRLLQRWLPCASLREKIRRGECEGSSNATRTPANDGQDVLRLAGGSFNWR